MRIVYGCLLALMSGVASANAGTTCYFYTQTPKGMDAEPIKLSRMSADDESYSAFSAGYYFSAIISADKTTLDYMTVHPSGSAASGHSTGRGMSLESLNGIKLAEVSVESSEVSGYGIKCVEDKGRRSRKLY